MKIEVHVSNHGKIGGEALSKANKALARFSWIEAVAMSLWKTHLETGGERFSPPYICPRY
jgi:hypothetical protein